MAMAGYFDAKPGDGEQLGSSWLHHSHRTREDKRAIGGRAGGCSQWESQFTLNWMKRKELAAGSISWRGQLPPTNTLFKYFGSALYKLPIPSVCEF